MKNVAGVSAVMLGAKQGNHGLSFDALGKSFDGQQGDVEHRGYCY